MSAEARRFVEVWSRAWRDHDPDALDALYDFGARFRSHPFRQLQPPREYAEWAFADEDELVDLRWGDPIVAEGRAVVEYWAVARSGGRETTIAGVALLRFGADGRVVEQRDYWAEEAGAREPPEGWGG